MEQKKARINWLRQPPAANTYSTVARFEGIADRWPQEAWSVVLDIPQAEHEGGVGIVGIRLLIGEDGPQGLLVSGSKFELYEGKKCVARGEVL
jgi:hypothetical protein